MKFATALISVLSISSVSAGTRGARKQENNPPLGSASLSRWLMSSGKSSGGKSSGGKSSSGSGSGSEDTDPCDVCADGKPDTIRLMYKLPSATSTLHVGKNTPSDVCGFSADYTSTNAISFNGKSGVPVSDGDIITLSRDFSGAWTSFEFDNGPDCQIHTSCSWPLVAGDQIGPFEVVGKENCGVDTPPPSNDGECVICDKNDDNNNVRPLSLTMQYFSGAGENSAYQIESKHASCLQSTSAPYPDGVTITAKDKKIGAFQTFTNVMNGDILVLNAPQKCNGGNCETKFEANTYFEIEGWTGGGMGEDFSDADTCHFHTSCSAPLVVGDQIGPFKLLEGNDCIGTPPTNPPDVPCIEVDKVQYDCGEAISVSWDFASAPPTNASPYNGFQGPAVDMEAGSRFPNGLPDDQIGIWPCGLDLSDPPPSASDLAIKTPEVWAWTCAEYGDSPLQSAECTAGTTMASGTIVFTDPEPSYVSAGLSHGLPIAPFYKDAAQTDVNECFQAILIRGRGPSVPPYVPICASQEFTIKAGTTAECQIRPSSNSFPRP